MSAAVEVWSVDLAAGTEALLALDAVTPVLADDEREKVRRVRDRRHADERLAATIALRVLLERVSGTAVRQVAFARGPAGKPWLPGARCHFSLSHVRGLALIALSRQPVGVDVERDRRPSIDAVRRARIERAAALIASDRELPAGPAERRFLQAWTRLEALAKADGRGIGRVLTEIGVLGAGRQSDACNDAVGLSAAFATLAASHGTLDLDLADGLVGAAAGPRGFRCDGPVRSMPVDSAGLVGMLGSRQELA